MDIEQVKVIQQRAEKATLGPWILAPELCGPDGQGVYTTGGGKICEVGDAYPRGDNNPQESMDFITHAREDIPALCQALLDAWEEIERKVQVIATLSDATKESYG